MNAFEQAIWEAERQLGATLSAQDFQAIVMDAKRSLINPIHHLTTVTFSIADGQIEARSGLGFDKMDLNAALVFVIRAYRLQKKLA